VHRSEIFPLMSVQGHFSPQGRLERASCPGLLIPQKLTSAPAGAAWPARSWRCKADCHGRSRLFGSKRALDRRALCPRLMMPSKPPAPYWIARNGSTRPFTHDHEWRPLRWMRLKQRAFIDRLNASARPICGFAPSSATILCSPSNKVLAVFLETSSSSSSSVSFGLHAAKILKT
jgi:hypothetical protein